jgi:hypothetical protein
VYKIKDGPHSSAVHVFAVLVVIFTLLSYFHDVVKIMADKNILFDFSIYCYFAKNAKPHFDLSKLQANAGIKEDNLKEIGPEALTGFGYQPFFYYLLKPLTFLEFRYAKILWILILHVLLIVSLGLLIILINPEKDFVLTSILIFMVFSFQPLRETVSVGNSDIVILFFLVLNYFFFKKNLPLLSGIFLAFAAFIKFSYGFLFLFFLWKRKYRIFFSAVITFFFLELFALLILGLDVHLAYIKVLQKITQTGLYSLNIYSHSVRVMFYRLLGDLDLSNLLSGLTALIVIAFTLYATRKKDESLETVLPELPLWIVTVFLISPYSNINYFIVLYLPFFLLLPYLLAKGTIYYRTAYVISFMLTGLRYSLGQFPQFYHGILSIFSNGLLYGAILLYILIFKVLVKGSDYSKK